VFSNGQTIFVGNNQCADFCSCIKDLAKRSGLHAAANQGRNSRRGRLLRGIQLRRNAAGAELALALTTDFPGGSLNVGYQRNPLGIAIQSRISVINPLNVAQDHQEIRLKQGCHKSR